VYYFLLCLRVNLIDFLLHADLDILFVLYLPFSPRTLFVDIVQLPSFFLVNFVFLDLYLPFWPLTLFDEFVKLTVLPLFVVDRILLLDLLLNLPLFPLILLEDFRVDTTETLVGSAIIYFFTQLLTRLTFPLFVIFPLGDFLVPFAT